MEVKSSMVTGPLPMSVFSLPQTSLLKPVSQGYMLLPLRFSSWSACFRPSRPTAPEVTQSPFRLSQLKLLALSSPGSGRLTAAGPSLGHTPLPSFKMYALYAMHSGGHKGEPATGASRELTDYTSSCFLSAFYAPGATLSTWHGLI